MKNKKQINHTKQDLMEKILIHLADCADFSFSYRFEKMFGISGRDIRALIKKDKREFNQSIIDLKRNKFIEKKKNYDGSVTVSLTEKGKLRALNVRFRRLEHKRERWDKKWRMVAFDIPEECKKGRNALRYRLKMAGFYKLQESLFLYPYDCEKEIRDFIKLFKIERYVKFALLDFFDGQERVIGILKLRQK